jgi:hypothetical protein
MARRPQPGLARQRADRVLSVRVNGNGMGEAQFFRLGEARPQRRPLAPVARQRDESDSLFGFERDRGRVRGAIVDDDDRQHGGGSVNHALHGERMVIDRDHNADAGTVTHTVWAAGWRRSTK